jgi:uncharacterized membrane protein (Fun14 family)
MDTDQLHDHPNETAAQGVCEALIADAPWRATSVMAAGTTMVAGLASWIADYSSPVFAQFGGSYIGGFFIGWAFRRFLKMAAMTAGVVLAGIASLKGTGWIDLDWTTVESHVQQSFTAIQRGAQGLRQFLSGVLPSAGAAAVGMFFGFRRK